MDKVTTSSSQLNGKIQLWEEKLRKLVEEDLPKAEQRLTAAAADGDWQENAEYEDAEEQVEVIKVKMEEIKGVLRDLKKTKK